ncbi:MAG: hypothetical protein K0S34_1498 [Bacillales bacterium]|jgi:uncharacterized protein (DUF58 family)|nr:hypothetical protein [Bacillales bacterium]
MQNLKSFYNKIKFQFYISLTILSIILFALFQGNFVSWFIVYSVLPIVLIAISLSIYPVSKIKVDRIINYERIGNRNIEVEIVFEIPFPIIGGWLSVKDDTPICNQERIFLTPFNKKYVINYIISDAKRGEHIFNNITFNIGDYFGFYNKEVIIQKIDRVVIFPRYVEYKFPQIITSNENGFKQNSTRQKDYDNVIGTRQYQKGDKFTWIDWKASARKQELISKEFSDNKKDEIVIILDGNEHEHFEAKMTLAMTLVMSLTKNKQDASILISGEQIKEFRINKEISKNEEIFLGFTRLVGVSNSRTARLLKNTEISSSIVLVINEAKTEILMELEKYKFRNNSVLVYYINLGTVPEELVKTKAKIIQVQPVGHDSIKFGGEFYG